MKRTFGAGDDDYITRKKNAFRFPKDKDSVFPQADAPVYIDKRTAAANTEYLIKDKGTKNKNLRKQAHDQNLSNALKSASDRAAGKVREDQIIDLNQLVKVDEYGNIDMDNEIEQMEEKFTINENKKTRKQKETGMDIDEVMGKPISIRSARRRAISGKKSKSYKIINY
jgi:hypothetical protein